MNYLLLIATAVTLAWDDPNPTTEVDGYIVYSRTNGGTYAPVLGTTNKTATVTNLDLGTTYYFAVTATNHYGLESEYSNELMVNMPSDPQAPTNLHLKEILVGATLQESKNPAGPWTNTMAWPVYVVQNDDESMFYRVMAEIEDNR